MMSNTDYSVVVLLLLYLYNRLTLVIRQAYRNKLFILSLLIYWLLTDDKRYNHRQVILCF